MMTESSSYIWNKFKRGQEEFTKWDYFGTPIRVNLSGMHTYKTCFGAIITVIFTAIMLTQMWLGFDKMISRSDPDYSFYRLTQSWRADEPLNLPEIGGQMYIGLMQTKEYKDGSKVSKFIDFDPAYVNGKIDYYEQDDLQARKDMPRCTDRLDFSTKIRNSNGLAMGDFDVMRCIPNEQFELYNVAGTSEQNSITLLFEECGGKYQKIKEFKSVIQEQAIQEALSLGIDPETIVIEEPIWEWSAPDCDTATEDCGYGLDVAEKEQDQEGGTGNVPQEDLKPVYEDCSERQEDEDCIEYWNIQCEAPTDITCLMQVIEASCELQDTDCLVNFMRAFCEKYDQPFCKSDQSKVLLSKTEGCLPGDWKCTGFQEMFGGPKGLIECAPWDLECTLIDQFGDTSDVQDQFPFMAAMPKSSLSIEELKLQEYIIMLKYDLKIWQKGLEGKELDNEDREVFHQLGSLVFGPEGFNDLYQGLDINNRIQSGIDQQARLFNALQLEGEQKPVIELMPDTQITAVEWARISEIMNFILSDQAEDSEDIWALYFSDFEDKLLTRQIYAIHQMENQLYGSEQLRLTIQSGELTSFKQIEIDTNMRRFISKYIEGLTEADKIVIDGFAVPRMPYTRIRFEEFGRLDEIKTFLIQDIWYKPESSLSQLENEAVIKLGVDLFGSRELLDKFRASVDSVFTESEQVIIDAAHRAFLEKYKVLDDSMIIYSGPKGDILNMPTSSIQANEWTRILDLTSQKLGNDSFERLFDQQKTVTAREDYALNAALNELFGQEQYQQLWRSNGIYSDGGIQGLIDDNMRSFIAKYDGVEKIDQQDQIVPRMPYTSLTLENIALIELIIEFKIGDLWKRAYDTLNGFEKLIGEEKSKVEELGEELMGWQAFQVYNTTNRDLTSDEQTSADQKMDLFMRWYEADVVTAEIPFMPYTSLTKSEYDRILKLLNEKLNSDSLWNRFVSGDLDLNVVERQKISTVGSEWLGQLNWLQFQSNEPFSAEQQIQVDLNSKLWLEANKDADNDESRRNLQKSSRFFYRKITQNNDDSRRKLVAAQEDKQVECASAQEIRDYLKDKTIIVFASRSFVKSDEDLDRNELVTYLEPVAEKRLDFKYHKRMEVSIQKQNIEIQDSYYQILLPEPELLTYPETRVQHEDVVTREYWDGDTQEYVNTKESMLAIKMWLETTTAEQKRVAYDSMTFLGDIGGLYDFFVIVIHPVVGIIVGDRLTYFLLSKLFIINTANSQKDEGPPKKNDSEEEEDSDDPRSKRNSWKAWLELSAPYKADCRTKIIGNTCLKFLMCRHLCPFRRKSSQEQILSLGERKVNNGLDIRNIIKSQDLLKTLMKLQIQKREKRKLMRLQRANLVLEAPSSDSDFSFDSEDDFKDFHDSYALFQEQFDEAVDQGKSRDNQYMRLFRGVLDRDALDPERKTHVQMRRARSKLARTMSSNSAFGFSMKRSKVMDLVSQESEGNRNFPNGKIVMSSKGNNDDHSDKDDGSDSNRAGTPPKIMKKNSSLSRDEHEMSSTSRELRNSRNMAQAANKLNKMQNSITTNVGASPLEKNDNLRTINYDFIDQNNTMDIGDTNRSQQKQRNKTELYGQEQILEDLQDLEDLTEGNDTTLQRLHLRPGNSNTLNTEQKSQLGSAYSKLREKYKPYDTHSRSPPDSAASRRRNKSKEKTLPARTSFQL